jgi:hypothetical protein
MKKICSTSDYKGVFHFVRCFHNLSAFFISVRPLVAQAVYDKINVFILWELHAMTGVVKKSRCGYLASSRVETLFTPRQLDTHNKF